MSLMNTGVIHSCIISANHNTLLYKGPQILKTLLLLSRFNLVRK